MTKISKETIQKQKIIIGNEENQKIYEEKIKKKQEMKKSISKDEQT